MLLPGLLESSKYPIYFDTDQYSMKQSAWEDCSSNANSKLPDCPENTQLITSLNGQVKMCSCFPNDRREDGNCWNGKKIAGGPECAGGKSSPKIKAKIISLQTSGSCCKIFSVILLKRDVTKHFLYLSM